MAVVKSIQVSMHNFWATRLLMLFSLSTLHREYAALMSLELYDFFKEILRPSLPSIGYINPEAIQKTMTQYRINEPQAIAINSSLRTNGFVLIQGYGPYLFHSYH